jgi:CheY-like chemotaxis protein
MTARPRVLVATASGTLALRLRLMLEAEGAEVVMASDIIVGTAPEVQMVVASTGHVVVAGRLCPGAQVFEVAENEDWDNLRRRLAAALGPDPLRSEAEEMVAALARARILLVDDSVTYREFIRLELTRLGAQVTACGNAEDALAHLTSGEWDCMLVDLVMPGVDGAQLCARAARLRRDSGQRYVLVVLSSREGKADLIRSLEAGADVFIGKSLDMPLFRAKLGAMLRSRFLFH